MHARFYSPDAERVGDVVGLPPDEAEHLGRVLRLKAGAHVRVFNGRGAEFDATVDMVGKNEVRVQLLDRLQAEAELSVAVTLAPAVLKGDKMDDVVRDAVMMGVAAIRPVITARSEMSIASLRRSRRRDRWQRIAVSSAKQCGRAVVPVVHEPCSFEDATTGSADVEESPGRTFMFVEPSATADAMPISAIGAAPRTAIVLVGPEGGWAAEELVRGARSCEFVTLGARTLRADAVAIVALTALLTRWNEL